MLDLWLLKLQVTNVNDIFLYFWVSKQMIKAMIYNASMPGDQNHSQEIPTQKERKPRCSKILEAM